MLVSIVFFPPIKEGKDAEFRNWFAWTNEEFAKHKGFVSRKLLLPFEGGDYAAVVEYENRETLKKIQSSPFHEEALQKVLPLLDGYPKPQFYEVVNL